MGLKIYNTLTRSKEEFTPLKHNYVRMYTCGLTVYDFMHIGHAKTYLFWDVLRRYLDYKGYDVYAVINNTDIDDRIIARSNELSLPFKVVAEFFTEAFYEDLNALGVLPYTITCNATDYINEMIETIKLIIENGFGYVVDGDVFYSVEKFSGYGKLSGYSLEDLIAGARVEVDERKRHPADFALWKSAKQGEPSWDSPWGKGRPGWHIECSTMAYHFFGGTYDIKGGAVDNLFPHHENEIAQTYAAYGIDLARYFVHPEHLLVEGTKMSKSLGNFITVRQALAKWKPAELRLYFLGTHYRTQMNFTKDGIRSAKEALARLNQFREVVNSELKDMLKAEHVRVEDVKNLNRDSAYLKLAEKLKEEFTSAMDDDLNTPRALAAIHSFISDAYKLGLSEPQDKLELAYAYRQFEKFCTILGIGRNLALTEVKPFWENRVLARVLEPILSRREEARKRKDFKTADLLRDLLSSAGIILEDTPSGTRWKLKEPEKD